MNATREEWRAVPGYEGYYEVSDQGRVKSMERTIPKGNHRKQVRERILRMRKSPVVGYPLVDLHFEGKSRTFPVHQLVLRAFVGPRPDGAVACHNDGNAQNNQVANLRWGTQQSNIIDIVRHGRHNHARKTHCPRNHPFDTENTYITPSSGGRICRTCQRDRHAISRSERAVKRAERSSK